MNKLIVIAMYALIGVVSFYAWPLAFVVAFFLIVVRWKTLDRQFGVILLILFAAILKLFLYASIFIPRLYQSDAIGRSDMFLAVLFPIEYPAVQEVVIMHRI